MTATVLEPSAVGTEFEEEIDHLICHCTKNNIAWCKLDVTDLEFVKGEAVNPICPLCALTAEQVLKAGRCPWGCSCEECGFEDEEPGIRGQELNFVVIDEWTGGNE